MNNQKISQIKVCYPAWIESVPPRIHVSFNENCSVKHGIILYEFGQRGQKGSKTIQVIAIALGYPQ